MNSAYKTISEKLIDLVKTSAELPWSRPWRKGRMLVGSNLVSGKKYRGINAVHTALVADLKGYDSNQWLTFKQANNLGGTVKKGEHGIPCLFFSLVERSPTAGDTRIVEEVPIYRTYTIFNVAQCDRISYIPYSRSLGDPYDHDSIAEGEALAARMKNLPPITHSIDNKAFYNRDKDIINVPALSEFAQPERYYATLFHEVTHSTGHRSRLNRKSLNSFSFFGDHQYSKEELVAEFGACFLGSEAGILSRTEKSHAAYLQGWLKALQNNPSWLIEAANQAQKAVDYLLS